MGILASYVGLLVKGYSFCFIKVIYFKVFTLILFENERRRGKERKNTRMRPWRPWGPALWHVGSATAYHTDIPCGHQFESTLLHFQCMLPDNAAGKAVAQVSRLLHTSGGPRSSSWLPPGPVVAIVASWRVNQQVQDVSFSASVSPLVTVSLPFKCINKS